MFPGRFVVVLTDIHGRYETRVRRVYSKPHRICARKRNQSPTVQGVFLLWSAIWLFEFHSQPENDPGVRSTELEYLNTNIQPKTKLPVPWRMVATSLPLWTVLIANYGSTVFYTVLIMYMPVYLKNIMKMDVSRNGFMSALPSLGQMIVTYLSGCCASFVQARAYANVTNIRKVRARVPVHANQPSLTGRISRRATIIVRDARKTRRLRCTANARHRTRGRRFL